MLRLIESVEQILSCQLVQASVAQPLEDLREGCPSKVRHAQETQISVEKILDGIEGHNVGMLQASQGQMFAAVAGSDLEDDGPVGEGGLHGQKDPAANAMAQLGQHAKAAERFADFGEAGWRWAARPGMTKDIL